MRRFIEAKRYLQLYYKQMLVNENLRSRFKKSEEL